jgi:hypothetical protein
VRTLPSVGMADAVSGYEIRWCDPAGDGVFTTACDGFPTNPRRTFSSIVVLADSMQQYASFTRNMLSASRSCSIT